MSSEVEKHSEPLKPERTVLIDSKSSRHGVKPDTIVLHITVSKNVAGLRDIDGVIEFTGNPANGASAHIINDREGHDARTVRDEDKAWACFNRNPDTLNIEQVEWDVNRTREQWLAPASKGGSNEQLWNTAAWVAYWSHKWDIPLVHRTHRGVCQHSELGAFGGGHSDCGKGYPIDVVISRAIRIRKEKYGH